MIGNAIAEAFIKVRPDTATFRAETAVGVKSAVRGGLAGLGAGRAGAVVGLGAIGGTAAVVAAALGAAVYQAAQLEQALNVLRATADLTDSELAQVAQQSRELGADLTLPGVSATDAANATLELSKAGLDLQNAMAGTKGVLQLAAAANISFAESAVFVGNALNAFKLPGEDAVHITDLLANASKLAQGEITDFGQAMQQSAAVANLAGVSVEELTGLITLLARAGISGSDAGTSIRTTLLRLIPTSNEAAEVVKALGISLSDSEGNIRPLAQIFEQYKQALAELNPVTRQAALSTIFGTDAIRAASIFASAGAVGIDKMTEAVSEQGTGAQIAAAKNQGLLGAFRNMGSQAETLGANIGSILVPAITDIANAASGAIGDVNDLVTALKGLDIPGGDKAAGPIKAIASQGVRLVPVIGFLKNVHDGIDLIKGQLSDPPNVAPLAGAIQGAVGLLTEGLGKTGAKTIKKSSAELAALARLEGQKQGLMLQQGQSEGIIRNAQKSVAAAKQALADTIRAGNEAIQAAAVQAKQNLVSIGNDLSQRAVDLIDAGPIGRKIKELQAQLQGSGDAGQKRRLKSDLLEAQEALASAQKQIGVVGQATPAQKKAIASFLRPFQDSVKDAQAALEEFTTEGVVTKLQKQAEDQKKAVTKGIADVIAAFNTGRINADQANKRIAKIIGSAVGDYRQAGKNLGLAFNEGFTAVIRGLSDQIGEIVSGPQTTKSGFEPSIVSPGDVAARAAGANAAAAAAVADAQAQLVQTTKEQLAEQKDTNGLLKAIATQQKAHVPKPVPRPQKRTGIDFVKAGEEIVNGPRGSRDRTVVTIRGGG